MLDCAVWNEKSCGSDELGVANASQSVLKQADNIENLGIYEENYYKRSSIICAYVKKRLINVRNDDFWTARFG